MLWLVMAVVSFTSSYTRSHVKMQVLVCWVQQLQAQWHLAYNSFPFFFGISAPVMTCIFFLISLLRRPFGGLRVLTVNCVTRITGILLGHPVACANLVPVLSCLSQWIKKCNELFPLSWPLTNFKCYPWHGLQFCLVYFTFFFPPKVELAKVT